MCTVCTTAVSCSVFEVVGCWFSNDFSITVFDNTRFIKNEPIFNKSGLSENVIEKIPIGNRLFQSRKKWVFGFFDDVFSIHRKWP